jgi:tRNA A-37 threonylcarbamoyl transferase component Bud32
MTLEIGQMVDNRYRVEKLLGQGGMGAVYRTWHTRLNRPIALKEMVPQPGLDADMLAELRQQFENEARVLATLSHPNLVRVTDYFSWEGSEYLVMDFVEGESLADRIQEQGPQPEPEVLHWAGQLLEALTYCHGKGVLHRDIKPQNIIVTPDGQAVLVDFGLVKLWDPDDPHTRTVMRGAGTPEYAPPEQYDTGLGHTDPRSDIYGLGATLYHALTGRTPPTATQRMANPSCFLPPRQINVTVSSHVEAAVLKAMEVAMPRRFQSAENMVEALHLAPQPLSPRGTRRVPPRGTVVLPEAQPEVEAVPRSGTVPLSQPRPEARGRRGRMGLWIGLGLAAVVCLVLVVGVGSGAYLFRRPTPTATAASIAAQPSATPEPAVTLAPTDMPSPSPSPRPIDVVSPLGGVLLQDGFRDENSGWEVGEFEAGRLRYDQGVYAVTSSGSGMLMWGVAHRNISDMVIDVDATQISAPVNDNNAYGVMCRVQPNDDGYLLRISGDGFYAIHRVVDDEFQALSDWTPSEAILQGNATNRIRAVCDGTRLALYANGELLAEVEDATFTQGDVALTATTFEDEPTTIHYDDLVVATPEDAARSAEVLYLEDFGEATSGWYLWQADDGSVTEIEDGHFLIFSAAGGWMWSRSEVQFTDVVIDADATQVSAPENDNDGYGVLCRAQTTDGSDGYALVISGDGFYSIHKISGGQWEALVGWTRSDAINLGNATNHIQAVCRGTALALRVNGQLLAETSDATYTSGAIGLAATTFEDDPVEIHFDNLIVRRPSD